MFIVLKNGTEKVGQCITYKGALNILRIKQFQDKVNKYEIKPQI